MLNVIKMATSMGIPVLPIHDEVVFPEDRQSDVEGILKEAFKWTFNDAGDFGQLTVKASKLEQEATVINVDLG